MNLLIAMFVQGFEVWFFISKLISVAWVLEGVGIYALLGVYIVCLEKNKLF